MKNKQTSFYTLTNKLSAAVYASDNLRIAFGVAIVSLILLILFTDINNKWNIMLIGVMLIYTHGIKKILGKKELDR